MFNDYNLKIAKILNIVEPTILWGELPNNFDVNKINVWYDVQNLINEHYKNTSNIEIHVISHKNNLNEILDKIAYIERLLGNRNIKGVYVTHDNPCIIHAPVYEGDDIEHYVLNYTFNFYE